MPHSRRLRPLHIRDCGRCAGVRVTFEAKVEAEFTVFFDAEDVNELVVYLDPVKVLQDQLGRLRCLHSDSVFAAGL